MFIKSTSTDRNVGFSDALVLRSGAHPPGLLARCHSRTRDRRCPLAGAFIAHVRAATVARARRVETVDMIVVPSFVII
jgi:hypothetical protein